MTGDEGREAVRAGRFERTPNDDGKWRLICPDCAR
jgi:hypothetical protein